MIFFHLKGRVLYSTYTTAENDKKAFDLWSGVTDVIQPSKGFTDEIYGHAITLRLKTCFRYVWINLQQRSRKM